MTESRSSGVDDGIDWSLTTYEGARREQRRRWAALPLKDMIQALEDMESLATRLGPDPDRRPPKS